MEITLLQRKQSVESPHQRIGGLLINAFLLLGMSLVAGNVLAATITYKTSIQGGEWSNPDNWTIDGEPAGRVPEDGDDVVLSSPSSAVYLGAYGFGGGTHMCLRTATPQLNSLSITGSRILAVYGWDSCIRAKKVSLNGGSSSFYGIIRPGDAFGNDMSNRVWIVAEELVMNNYSAIWGRGRGYAGKAGPCWQNPARKYGQSASHGGYQGGWITGSGGDKLPEKPNLPLGPLTYGSITEPTIPGSGGNSTGYQNVGGGAVYLDCKKITMSANAEINADGWMGTQYQGGGSGGSIYIKCETISGGKAITANGGDMSAPSAVSGCGGAGGGRIAISYDPEKQRTVSLTAVIEARGGVAYQFGGGTLYKTTLAQRPRANGHCGTVWFTDGLIMSRAGCRVKGRVYTGTPVKPYVFDTTGDLVLKDSFFEFDDDDFELNIGGNLCITGSCATINGFRFNGLNAKVTVGGDVSLKGSALWLCDGGDVKIGGNCDLAPGSDFRNCAELTVVAAPETEGDKIGATVKIGGKWTIGNYSACLPECNLTNGSVVAMSAKSLNVAAGGWIYAEDAGWGNRLGPGYRTDFRMGLSHGGKGGTYQNNPSGTRGGAIYGNEKRPLTLGTSSSNAGGNLTQRGGGVVWLETEKGMHIDGTITANGLGERDTNYQAPSSGGSVLLQCGGEISGSGVVSADGGQPQGTHGGGGGGRVAIYYYTKADDFAVAVHALGGCQVYGEPEDDVNWHGGNGSVYWKQWHKGLMLLVR